MEKIFAESYWYLTDDMAPASSLVNGALLLFALISLFYYFHILRPTLEA